MTGLHQQGKMVPNCEVSQRICLINLNVVSGQGREVREGQSSNKSASHRVSGGTIISAPYRLINVDYEVSN